MTAQNVWRLTFGSSQGGQYIQLTEVAFLDAGGNDLSVGGAASASSEYSASYTADKAFDKSLSTDWCTAQSAPFPAWLQYTHDSPVDVAQVRIVCSANNAWLPVGAGELGLRAGDLQQDRYMVSAASGSFGPNQTVVLSVSPYVPPTIVPVPALSYLQGVAGAVFAGIKPVPATSRLLPDYLRPSRPPTGVVADTVTLVSTPGAPAQPFANGRVWLLRLTDGRIAWQGYSDAQGRYRAEGLELGAEYIPVGIDPTGQHKAVAAGPVVALELP